MVMMAVRVPVVVTAVMMVVAVVTPIVNRLDLRFQGVFEP